MSNIDWDDLRFVLKVAEAGSIAGAAESLQVNRTTVLRRINQFEKQLDAQLFDRHGSGYSLAPGAEELLEAAMAVEKTIDDLHRRVLGKTLVLQGNLCVTTTDSLFSTILAPQLAEFHRKQPGIRLELLVSNRRLSLSRRDADVGIRAGMGPPDGLTSHRLCPWNSASMAARRTLPQTMPVTGGIMSGSAWIHPYSRRHRASGCRKTFQRNGSA